jgi:soluble lytic murein transglycosylase-like protein
MATRICISLVVLIAASTFTAALVSPSPTSAQSDPLTDALRDQLVKEREVADRLRRALLKTRVRNAKLRRNLARVRQRVTFSRRPNAHLQRIAQCESGGRPDAVSPGGTYRGKYQFDYGTWRSVGGSGDPAAASEAEQDHRAQLLYDARGSAPWPVCQYR